MNYKKVIKTDFLEREFEEILTSDTDVLLGVSEDAKNVLKQQLGVRTVFDLGASRIFNDAEKLCNLDKKNLFSRYNLIPSDVVDSNVQNTKLEEFYKEPIESLYGIGDNIATVVKEALSINLNPHGVTPPSVSVSQQRNGNGSVCNFRRKGIC